MLIDKWKQEAERLNAEINKDVEPTLLLELCTMRNRLQFCITDAELLLNAQKFNSEPSSTIAANPMLGGPKAKQLSCGCTPMQRTMITFTDDGDYCGGCGKLIPTT